MKPGLLQMTAVLALSVVPLAPARAGDASARAEALRIARQATAAYKSASYAEALAQFEKAYATFPAPALLSNLSHVELKLGHCDKALDYAQRFSSSGGSKDTATPQAGEWVRRVQGECPEVQIESDPAGASVLLDRDEAPAGVTPWKGRLPSGEHSLRLRMTGMVEAHTSVVVQSGSPVRVSMPLTRVSPEELPPLPPPEPPVVVAPAPVAPPVTPVTPPILTLPPQLPAPPPNIAAVKTTPSPAAPPRIPPGRALGWSAVAAGGAALVVGLVLGLGVRSDTAALAKVSASRSGSAAQQEGINSINGRAIGADVLLGAGGAFAATGTALVIVF